MWDQLGWVKDFGKIKIMYTESLHVQKDSGEEERPNFLFVLLPSLC